MEEDYRFGKIDLRRKEERFWWRVNDYYEDGYWEEISKRLYLALRNELKKKKDA